MEKKSFYQEPQYQQLMASNPSAGNILQMLEQHNTATPQTPIQGNSLLAAGLGAGVGMGVAGGQAYQTGLRNHAKRVHRIADRYARKHITPHHFTATNPIGKLFGTANYKLTKKLYDRNKETLRSGLQTTLADDVFKQQGWKGVSNMPKSKLLMAGGAGTLLGVLANKILSGNQ